MLFFNTHIEEAVGHCIFEDVHTATCGHCRGDSDHSFVHFGQFQEHFSENILVSVCLVFACGSFTCLRIEQTRCMPSGRIGFSWSISLAFDGDGMQNPWPVEIFESLQGFDYLRYIIAIYWSEISEPERFEKVAS